MNDHYSRLPGPTPRAAVAAAIALVAIGAVVGTIGFDRRDLIAA